MSASSDSESLLDIEVLRRFNKEPARGRDFSVEFTNVNKPV